MEPSPAREPDARERVWLAFSEFWLDTELTERDYDAIAEVARASGFSLEELERICFDEVAPAVHLNLLSVAGVWGAFDETWLFEQIRSRQHRRAPVAKHWWSRFTSRRQPYRGLGAQEAWDEVRRRLQPRDDNG